MMWVAFKRIWISTEIKCQPEEMLILGFSLVQGLEITWDPYLVFSKQAAFTVFPGQQDKADLEENCQM